jgi:hypothetical protein
MTLRLRDQAVLMRRHAQISPRAAAFLPASS